MYSVCVLVSEGVNSSSLVLQADCNGKLIDHTITDPLKQLEVIPIEIKELNIQDNQ